MEALAEVVEEVIPVPLNTTHFTLQWNLEVLMSPSRNIPALQTVSLDQTTIISLTDPTIATALVETEGHQIANE